MHSPIHTLGSGACPSTTPTPKSTPPPTTNTDNMAIPEDPKDVEGYERYLSNLAVDAPFTTLYRASQYEGYVH